MILLWLLLGPILGIQVGMRVPDKDKCFGEALSKDELILIEFNAAKPITVSIRDPNHNQIFSEDKKKSIRSAFSAHLAGHHIFCVKSDEGHQLVDVKMNMGPDAKDYSQIAKKEHLESGEISLRKIEEQLRSYHKNVLYLRSREERMRATNNSTAFRVIGFCLFSVGLMIAMGCWQMLYFKQFFKAKKII